MFYSNIGKRIRVLAAVIAIVLLVLFLALAAVFLLAGLRASDPTMREAGFEGAVLFLILALVAPFFTYLLYGFGKLVESAAAQAEYSKEMRDILKKSLTDGTLSDETARKVGIVLAKALPAATAKAPYKGIAPTRPVVRETPPATETREAKEPLMRTAPTTPKEDPVTPTEPSAGKTPAPEKRKEEAAPVQTAVPPAPPAFTAEAEPAPAEAAKHFVPPAGEKDASDPFGGDVAQGLKPVRPLHSEETY